MERLRTASLAAFLFPALSLAITLHVPLQYPTIQAGINAAQDYDTVLVAAGTYYEHIDFVGKEIIVKSASGPEATTIDGGLSVGYVVTFSGWESPESILEGFTITHGHGQNPHGGGIFCDTLSGPTIRGNHIVFNGDQWNWFGAGISAWNAAPHIEENLIQDNMCVYFGAGIYLAGCFDVTIRHNVISQNWTTSGYGVAIGGGLYSENSEAQVEWNLFEANWADPNYGVGGAVAIAGSGNCSMRFNTFAGNTSEHGGGVCLGTYLSCTASILFTDNILVNSPHGGGFLLDWGTPILRIDFNDVWNNVPYNYSGCAPGLFDISADPQFSDIPPYGYTPLATSPCVDAASFMANPDPDGTRADMGAFPYDRPGVNVTFQPYVWPINIPASGGWFAGHFFLTNNTSAPANFDFWVDVLLPDSTVFGPVLLRQNLTFNPGQQTMRASTQNVPAGAPAGNYLYRTHTGNYQSGEIYCEMDLPFTKTGVSGAVGKWTVQGEMVDWGTAPERTAAWPLALQLEASPNPFNPTTAISYQLSASSYAALRIYNIAGSLVETLVNGWREVGTHELTFDASRLPSGMYWAVLEAGGAKSVQKLMLVK